MTTPDQPPTWAPDACTLPTAERPLRLAEFDDLFTGLRSLDRRSPVHVRMHLDGAAGLEETARDLTARETECCSFFTFTTTPMPSAEGDQIMLDVQVPSEHAAVLEALARSSANRSRARKGELMDTIGRDELVAFLDQPGTVLVEALPAEQYEAEHLPGAVNLPGDLDAEVAAWLAPDKTALVVTYCSGELCRRSKTAARAFEQLGYTNVRVYEGGKADWLQAGLPLLGTRAHTNAGGRL